MLIAGVVSSLAEAFRCRRPNCVDQLTRLVCRSGSELDAVTPVTSNDNMDLAPDASWEGHETLTFDFPEVEVGIAEYAAGPTGCTVFRFDRALRAAIDVRGGAPGYIGQYSALEAVCFAGGSLYGLEAASGVAAEIFAQRGYPTGFSDIATVFGAIIYDYGPRHNAIYPDKNLGRLALKTARRGIFPLGSCGAGRSATVGKTFDRGHAEPAGQGGAYRQINTTKVAVFTVVNSVGAIVNRQGQVVRGHRPPQGSAYHAYEYLEKHLAGGGKLSAGNTTLTLIVTNQRLEVESLIQFSRQVHASMARAIQPFHTLTDGDVLISVTTNAVESADINVTGLGILASELAWDAVLSCWVGAG